MFALALALVPGCGMRNAVTAPHPNQRPVVEFTSAPLNPTGNFEYFYRMSWLGFDPDGRIEEFRYAIDPPAPTGDVPFPETTWVRTTRNEERIRFTATQPESVRTAHPGATDFHTFVLKAIDNGGAGGRLQSEPLVRSFYSYTVAPTVQILAPAPSDRARTYSPPSVEIRWTGTDEDGVFNSQRPNAYKTILLNQNSEVPFAVALASPDSVRRYYAPRNWAGWDSVGGNVTSKLFRNLVPGQDYMFCVVALDEAGAYSPVFSMASNMLNFRATLATQGGPKLTVWNDAFFYRYNPAVYSTLPQYQIRIEVPDGERIPVEWIGEAASGAYVTEYRWALDIEDLSDPTPRRDEHTDLTRWSQPGGGITSATVGPFGPGESHFFYIEAVDNLGLRSLATIAISVARVTLEKPLLIVNDTRLTLDQRSSGSTCMDRPRGRWPMSAELDTFLFARGGVPWRCYPAGTLSETGIFYGYPFDTLGTRTGQSEVRVPLAVLGRYQRVIWITDSNGAINDGYGTTLSSSIGALRYMCTPGHSNSLGAYLRRGGEVWLLGGAAAYASLVPYNRTNNDITSPAPGITFSYNEGELVPGRMIYDRFGWRSEIKMNYGPNVVSRVFGRHDSTGNVPAEYQRLPERLRAKSEALGDHFPPWRSFIPGDFFQPNFDIEYLSRANRVVADVDPDPFVTDERSTVDTLYRAVGPALMSAAYNRANVCMTRTVDPNAPRLILTGFNVWNWTRSDDRALVDAVLGDFWHLTRAPAPPAAPEARAARTR